MILYIMGAREVVIILIVILLIYLYANSASSNEYLDTPIFIMLTVKNNNMFKQATVYDDGSFIVKNYGKLVSKGTLNANQMTFAKQLLNDPYFAGLNSGSYGTADSAGDYYHITTKTQDLEGILSLAPTPFVNTVTQVRAMIGF
jgi:hypothetical protein